jgi:cytochrome c peroxidase
MMKQGLFICRCLPVLVLAAAVLTGQATASEADNPAWRAFLHALGESSLIAASADHDFANDAFRPLPPASTWQIEPDKFRLGSRLFHESRLSTGNGIACVTCHAGTLSGADRRRVSIGVGGAEGKMNALSVFNAALNFRQFWDGRAVTLEDQALLPIATEFEMANSLDAVRQMLRSDPDYIDRFSAVYPDGVSIANMADAMAHFQRSTFIRLDTPFQRYLRGDEQALDEQEKFGLQRFQELGCSNCHNGINLGGNSYQKLGSLRDYYSAVDNADIDDAGLASRSGLEKDRHVFRVPALHGVATTPPYLHDGSVPTLEEVVRLMSEFQLGREISDSDVQAITAFLGSLGGYFNSSRDGLPATVFELESGQGAWQVVDSSLANSLQDNEHQIAYRRVLQLLPDARQKLLQELEAIASGQVAHFDYAQFQHLELIRFSRALTQPPSSLPETAREKVTEVAASLQQQVMALEWPIADYLRAWARAGAFELLALQPEKDTTLAEDVVIAEQLSLAREQAQQSLATIRAETFTGPLEQLELLLSNADR